MTKRQAILYLFLLIVGSCTIIKIVDSENVEVVHSNEGNAHLKIDSLK